MTGDRLQLLLREFRFVESKRGYFAVALALLGFGAQSPVIIIDEQCALYKMKSRGAPSELAVLSLRLVRLMDNVLMFQKKWLTKLRGELNIGQTRLLLVMSNWAPPSL
mmetsp:Transcript_9038/g.26998  ORF Transcript_9038/g.26998 Transcript_9038/m.26998 type:complete len:108 (+) Transcript_9038:714-1037(+)